MSKCPLALDVRSFLEKAGNAKWNTAYKTLRNAVVFPAITAALCPSPCESCCQRRLTGDEPVATRLIEEACVKFAKNRQPDIYAIPPKKERIAIIGAGISGLCAALCLAQKKYPVTVYEKNNGWGGALRVHQRFSEFDAELALQFSAAAVEFLFNTEITSLDVLSGFDMIYVATGAGGSDFNLLSDWDSRFLSCSEPRVFLGGALTGVQTLDGITQGKSLSKTADIFFQTGKAFGASEGTCDCTVFPPPVDTPSVPRVVPSEPARYTGDEAAAEAARCLQCDCDRCMASCEMLGSFRKKPKKIAMEVYTDTQARPPFASHTLTRQAYSCNMCGHCKELCPMDIDLGALLHVSRSDRAEGDIYPQALHDYWLREMDFSTGDGSFYSAPKGGKDCRYVFFPGCQLGAHNPDHVIQSYEFLNKNHDAGIFQGCCGAPAYWAGDVKRQNANFEEIRRIWRALGEMPFVFACASCESVFAMFLPEIPRVSLYELLNRSSDIRPGRIYQSASVFDPCNARKNHETEEAVRRLAQKSGTVLYELPEKNRCCGYGGHIRLANPELYEKITENRAGMGENPYIVYCANCRDVFLSLGKDCVHILEMALNLPRDDRIPKIDEKRENTMKVKSKLMKEIKDEVFTPQTCEWDAVELVVSGELAENIEKKLISLSDIREAIWDAESRGDKFVDEFGICRCSLQKPVVTYWVTYKIADNGVYEVIEAYSHRMRFSREEV